MRAARFYRSVFKRSKILDSGDMSTSIRIEGLEIILFDGGPHYRLDPAASLFLSVKTQKQVDYYWNRLSAGGEPLQCGWLTDRFGVTWQIIPEILPKLLFDSDEEKAGRTMAAMLEMKKLDIAALKAAHAGSGSGRRSARAVAARKRG